MNKDYASYKVFSPNEDSTYTKTHFMFLTRGQTDVAKTIHNFRKSATVLKFVPYSK